MIFPILNGILSFRRTPVTWLLFSLNLIVFLSTWSASELSQAKLESFIKDDVFSLTQGIVFAKFIDENPHRYPATLQLIAHESLSKIDGDRRRLLGGMAMRDSLFLKNAVAFSETIHGDQVAFKWWKGKFAEAAELRELHPSYGLGVTQTDDGFERRLAYQFAHSGSAHFVGNMIFFLLFASSLELIVGGLGVLITYLFSGVFAALFFSLMNEASAVPLIGASGAVSGVMSLFCVLLWNRKVLYAYFLLIPKKGYAGLVLLPAWVTLVLWFLSDLAGYWATPSELGGIAYSAHVGGEICGALIGLILLGMRQLNFFSPSSARNRGESYSP